MGNGGAVCADTFDQSDATLLVDRMEIAGHMILDQLVIWGEANYIHMAQ